MKLAIAITLIVCGTLFVAMPMIARLLNMPIADIGSLLYFALGALMITSAIAGSVIRRREQATRGFEPLPVSSAV